METIRLPGLIKRSRGNDEEGIHKRTFHTLTFSGRLAAGENRLLRGMGGADTRTHTPPGVSSFILRYIGLFTSTMMSSASPQSGDRGQTE